jgi:putative membrane protein insertion efficiency factor
MLLKAFIQSLKGLHYIYKCSLSRIFNACAPNCGCRFFPSCSDYYVQATEKFGITEGLRMGLKRLLRCSGLSDGGYDPVPDSNK